MINSIAEFTQWKIQSRETMNPYVGPSTPRSINNERISSPERGSKQKG